MIELPPLPYGASPTYGYTEAEMRAYGEACARAALVASAERLSAIYAHNNALVPGDMAAAYCAEILREMATAPSSPSSSQTRS
jgi:hypothetical protein